MSESELLQASLNKFYESRLHRDRSFFDDTHLDELSSPLLISIDDDYLNAPIRIMFVGKETNGWLKNLRTYYEHKSSLDRLMCRYRQQIGKKSWKGRFFPMLARTAKVLLGKKATAIAWTNLMRMDLYKVKNGTRNSRDFSRELTSFSRRVLRFEIRLLKPDVIIFACGASYDSVIKNFFPVRSESKVIEKRALWQFKIGKILCFRAQHPQSTRRKIVNSVSGARSKSVKDFYDDIFRIIKENYPDMHKKPGKDIQ